MLKSNRVFDHPHYGVKLKEVWRCSESKGRMFNPWIQRYWYVLCHTGMIRLITVSMYLIVTNCGKFLY